MTTWAIGDLHGCLAPLERLLDALHFDPRADRLWFVGDIAPRGPEALATLRFLRSLGKSAITVLGNHDLHLLAVLHGLRRPSPRDRIDALLAASDRDELERWLRTRPLLHVDRALGATLVHAGIHPHWSFDETITLAAELERLIPSEKLPRLLARMYGDGPERWSAALGKQERRRFAINAFTRMRYCRANGALDFSYNGPPATAPRGLLPWYRVPGRVPWPTRIVFGHWSSHPAMSPPDVLPLDRGCVWSGALVAHALETGETVSVRCR